MKYVCKNHAFHGGDRPLVIYFATLTGDCRLEVLMRTTGILILFFFMGQVLIGQDPIDRKEYTAIHCEHCPNIDGDLSDPAWKDAEIANDFVQNNPYPGKEPSAETYVRVLYNDDAIYISARMDEKSRDSVTATLSQRDDLGNADYFGVIIDPYGQGLNAFGFYVTAAGVQRDVRFTRDFPDASLNMAWESRVVVDDHGWQVEIQIPYSAIRFPKKKVRDWRVNFIRRIRRIREFSYWNPVDPEKYGMLNQAGILKGIEDIEAPVRLALFPYVSGYVEHYPYDIPEIQNTSYTFNGGMDLKYGLNEAFTLDMTLVPDFGQVQFDNQVLNLSPFEVRFNERRQFFTEGMGLFNKGGLFYSRRVGGTPIDPGAPYQNLGLDEVVISNPTESRLLNATKVSGRSKKGLGVGLFNGLTEKTYATIENEAGNQRTVLTDPLSNYSVVVLDQNLKNNSSVSFVNTNVMREGAYYDANVTGAYFDFQNKRQNHWIGGGGSVSQQYYTDSLELGHKWNLGFGKVAGRFQWDLGYVEESNTYEINDLGFLLNNNSRTSNVNFTYNWFDPFWKLLRANVSLGSWYGRLYEPDEFTELGFSVNGNVTTQNFLSLGTWIDVVPISSVDFFEPRVWGRRYLKPANINFGGYYSSDFSRPFAFSGRVNYRKYDREGRYDLYVSAEPRIRVGDRLMIIYEINRDFKKNDEGAALNFVSGGSTMIGDSIVFGKRDRTTITNTLNLNYIFTNRMGVTFRMRHYWSKVDYNSFHLLNEDGTLGFINYDGLDANNESVHNNSFNAFTIDMAFRWVFAPGSEMSVVWKNSIFTSNNFVDLDYTQNVRDLMREPQTNSFSIKVLYYLDYAMLTRKTIRIRN